MKFSLRGIRARQERPPREEQPACGGAARARARRLLLSRDPRNTNIEYEFEGQGTRQGAPVSWGTKSSSQRAGTFLVPSNYQAQCACHLCRHLVVWSTSEHRKIEQQQFKTDRKTAQKGHFCTIKVAVLNCFCYVWWGSRMLQSGVLEHFGAPQICEIW